MPELSAHIQERSTHGHCLPFIALTETWLKSYISDAQLHIPGYVVSRSDREKRVGGGVLLYSHTNIPVSMSDSFDDGICEGLFCKFGTANTCVAVAYRPPNAPVSSFNSLLNFFSSCIDLLNDDSLDLLICGDFNLPLINWDPLTLLPGGSSDTQQSAQSLLAFMSKYLLSQYVLTPTRGQSVLDLFITNNSRLVTNVQSESTHLSDHNMVDIMLAHNPVSMEKATIPNFNEESFRSLDFHKADYDSLRGMLGEVNWSHLRASCSFEEFPAVFTDKLFEICSACVPRKTVPTGRPKHLNALRRKRNRQNARLQALVKKDAPQEHIQKVRYKVALLQYDIRCGYVKKRDEKETCAIEKIKSNPKFFYSYAKSLSKIKSSINMLFDSKGEVTTNTQKMADLLQKQFSSVFSDPDSPDIQDPDFPPPTIQHPQQPDLDFMLTDDAIASAIKAIPSDSASGPDGIPAIVLKNCAKELLSPLRIIWEESFDRGTVPKYYKDTIITPLYKKGDRARAVNYRPVALTSHVIKVFERVIRGSMVDFIEKNQLLCDNQHGFRAGRSCLTQLLSHVDDIVQGLTKNADTDAIYLDFAKAFDKVDHKLLLKKLRRLGFHEKLVQWIESFLTGREQRVVLDGVSSVAAIVLSGVPQGTVLGPLLFILFINDMKLCVTGSIIRFFADDTRILRHIYSLADTKVLQEDLLSVVQWAKRNNMALHEDKFELLVHRHRHNNSLSNYPFAILDQTYQVSDGNMLYPAEAVKDLGVIVSSDLSWTPHVSMIAERARKVAAWVLSAFKTRNKLTMMTLYKSLIRSHLEYCCPLWSSSKNADIQQLEGVQRTFTSRIAGYRHLNYWQRLKALNLMSLQRRRERYMIIHMWKILHGQCPNDINIQFSQSSRHGKKAVIPQLAQSCSQRNQTLQETSFRVMGPRLWNIIPAHINGLEDPLLFKEKLTNFVRTFPDEPSVAGYMCRSGNSLLDWTKNMADSVLPGWSTLSMAQ